MGFGESFLRIFPQRLRLPGARLRCAGRPQAGTLPSAFTASAQPNWLPDLNKFAIIMGFPDSQGVCACWKAEETGYCPGFAHPADLEKLAAPCCHQAHKNQCIACKGRYL